MSVKIYTMTHKHFQEPDSDIYIPLHVGRALAEDLGYLGDDTGENISSLNPYYGELTGLYWIWKNETKADIVGVCHYRRFFLSETGGFMSQEEYETALKDCDVMVSELLSNGNSNWDNYAGTHNIKDMETVGEAIKEMYPADHEAFCDVLADTKCCYGNLMVTTLEKYREYCAWLFPLLEEAGKNIDVSEYDVYHKRIYGFLSEVLLYVWVRARGYHIREGRIGLTAEKAETVEFKKTIGHLIKQGDIGQAKDYFYRYQKLRPDIRLDMSDVRGEIPVIEKLLYIMHEEKKQDETGLLDLSKDLTVLIGHYKNAHNLISKYGHNAREKGKAYFEAFTISDTAFRMIGQDVNGELLLYDYINEENPAKKVSVIVPVRGQKGLLPECIGNLVHQTMEDIEIIFIVSDPDDGCLWLLKECQQQYAKHVRVIMQEAWNEKRQLVNGEYMMFVRAGDLPDVKICDKLYTKAIETRWKLTGGNYIDSQTGHINPMLAEDKVDGLDTKINMPWGLLIDSTVWKRNDLIPEIQDGNMNMDMDGSLLQVLKEVDAAGCIEDIVYRYNG